MEIIQLEGYIEEEKFNIAKRYLVPKQIKLHGLEDKGVSFADASIREVIQVTQKEAGVRNLERKIATVLRKTAREIVKDEMKSKRREKESG